MKKIVVINFKTHVCISHKIIPVYYQFTTVKFWQEKMTHRMTQIMILSLILPIRKSYAGYLFSLTIILPNHYSSSENLECRNTVKIQNYYEVKRK